MTQLELMCDVLTRNLQMFSMTVADLSDADFLARPVAGANHATWQIGHLINAETMFGNTVKPGSMPELPAGFGDKFKKDTATNDDPGFFPPRAVIMDQLNKTHTALIAAVKTMTQADLDKAGPERMAAMAPTMGHLVMLNSSHLMMHMGQLQVLRRKLGKPVLF